MPRYPEPLPEELEPTALLGKTRQIAVLYAEAMRLDVVDTALNMELEVRRHLDDGNPREAYDFLLLRLVGMLHAKGLGDPEGIREYSM